MLIRNFALWIVLAGVLGAALGGSLVWALLPQSHGPQYRGDDADREAREGDRRPEPASSRSSQHHAPSEKQGEHSEAPKSLTGPEWSIVWVTFLLAIVTAILAVYTGLLYRSTRQIATDSAAMATNEFLATHRPKLRVRYFKLIVLGPSRSFVRFNIVNTGDTEGRMLSCRGIVEWLHPKKLPPVVTIAMKEAAPPRHFLVGESEEVTFDIPPDPREGRPITAFSDEFHLVPIVYGLIEYSDKIGVNAWRTAFCRYPSGSTGRLLAADDRDYEYED